MHKFCQHRMHLNSCIPCRLQKKNRKQKSTKIYKKITTPNAKCVHGLYVPDCIVCVCKNCHLRQVISQKRVRIKNKVFFFCRACDVVKVCIRGGTCRSCRVKQNKELSSSSDEENEVGFGRSKKIKAQNKNELASGNFGK